jgi:hypothetical protein
MSDGFENGFLNTALTGESIERVVVTAFGAQIVTPATSGFLWAEIHLPLAAR